MLRKWTLATALSVSLAGCAETGTGIVPEETTPIVRVASVVIDDVSDELLPGKAIQLVARAVDARGETLADQVITFSAAHSLAATISANGVLNVIAPGAVKVTASAGGMSATREFIVNYPLPTLFSITPDIVPGVAAAVVTVQGSGFHAGTVVRLDDETRATAVISQNELRVDLTALDNATARTAVLTVFNPAPGGGTSARKTLTVAPVADCDFQEPLTLGAFLSGRVDASDCNSGTTAMPSYRDRYTFATTVESAVTLTLNASAFDPSLVLTDGAGAGTLHAIASATRPTSARLRLLLPPSTYTVTAGMVGSSAVGGAYTFASTLSATREVTNCDVWFAVLPTTLAGTITKADCGLAPHGPGSLRVNAGRMHEWYWDEYRVVIRAGQTVTITFESTAFLPAIYMSDSNGVYVAENYTNVTGIAEIVYTARTQGVYKIEAGPRDMIGLTGAYTIRLR